MLRGVLYLKMTREILRYLYTYDSSKRYILNGSQNKQPDNEKHLYGQYECMLCAGIVLATVSSAAVALRRRH